MGEPESLPATWWRYLRIVVMAGVPVGVVVGGLGSRLFMFALRLTSPDRVLGVQSDDDFTIGEFTLGGTYNLMLLGAFVGVLGAFVYLLVRPWLIGARWFRYGTIAAACGAVVGSMLLHADGIDFRLLEPAWFAMALFVTLPALFGLTIGPAVDWMEQRPLPTARRQLIAPVALVALFPPSAFVVVVVAVALVPYVGVISATRQPETRIPMGVTLVIRGLWLFIAVMGLLALIGDIRDINAVN